MKEVGGKRRELAGLYLPFAGGGTYRHMDMEKGSQVIEKNMSKILEVSFNESLFNYFFYYLYV